MRVFCRAFALFLVLVAGPSFADDVTLRPSIFPDPQKGSVVVLEEAPVPGVLTPDIYYIINSEKELIILSSPPGLVKVTASEGPIKLKGRFFDKPNERKSERTFKGKYLYEVEPIGTGEVELFAIPKGIEKETDVLRRRISIAMDGTAPDIVPVPTSSLVKSIQTAFNLDKDEDRLNLKTQLADLYTKGSLFAKTSGTYSDLFTAMAGTSEAKAISGALPNTQSAIQVYLNGKIPGKGAGPMPVDIVKARAAFDAVSDALNAVK